MTNSDLSIELDYILGSTNEFLVRDVANYSGETYTNILGNLKAVDPDGQQFHNNTSWVSPDIDHSVDPFSANFPLAGALVDGVPKQGQYTFTYTVRIVDLLFALPIISNNSGANTLVLNGDQRTAIAAGSNFECVDAVTTPLTIVSTSYSATTQQTTVTVGETLGSLTAFATFNFTKTTDFSQVFRQVYSYEAPDVCISVDIDNCCSTLTLTDVTTYPSYNTLTRLHTISYPQGMATPIADIESPLQEVTVSPIWTGTWTDVFTADIELSNGIINITDNLRGVKSFTVSSDALDCQIKGCLQNVVNKYSAQLTTNPAAALETGKYLTKALGLLAAYQLSKKCGDDNAADYLSKIKAVAETCGCDCGCDDCADDTPQQVVGCCENVGLSDFTITIESSDGSITVTTTQVGDTTEFDVIVSQAWFETQFLAQLNVSSIDELSDVDLTVPPTAAQVLTWDGTKWVAGSPQVSLLQLIDVDPTPAPSDQQVVYWDAGASKFMFKSIAAPSIATCTDVLLTALASGDILKYNGTDWVNVDNFLSLLSDVNTTGLVDGMMLVWDTGTSKWIVQTPVTDLTSLTDVTISSPANREILMYNGAEWTNAPAPTFSTIANGSFASGFGNTYGGGFGSVQWIFDSYNQKVTIRGACSNSNGAVGGSVLIFTFPNATYFPTTTIPFRCTVGIGATNAVAIGDINTVGQVTIYSYIDPDNPSTGNVSGIPAGGISFDLISWYII